MAMMVFLLNEAMIVLIPKSAFTLGRLIIDNTLLVAETLHTYQNHCSGHRGLFTLKLDMVKLSSVGGARGVDDIFVEPLETSSSSSGPMRRVMPNANFSVELFDGSSHFGMWQGEVLDALFQQVLCIAIEEEKLVDRRERMGDNQSFGVQHDSIFSLQGEEIWLQERDFCNMNEQITAFNDLVADLLGMDETFKDENMALMLFSFLPDEFEHLETMLLHGKDIVTFKDVIVVLYSYELRKKTKKESKYEVVEAMALESKGPVVTMRDGVLKVTSGALVMMKGIRKNNLYYYQGSIIIGAVATASGGKTFWVEVVTYACNLINRLPSSAIRGKIPLEVWFGKPATDYDSLHIFGSTTYYHVKESKLDPRAKKAFFMGITHGVNGKEGNNEAPQQMENNPKQVEFHRSMIPEVDVADSLAQIEELEDEEYQTQELLETLEPLTVIRPRREICRPAQFADMMAHALPVIDDDTPITYQEAMKSLESKRAIGCKWVFAKKDESHSKKDVHCKARLVVNGYAQKEGIDYNEVFSPVVKHSSIRILLAQLNLELAQIDVKMTFLHGDLEEEIYITQPEGYKNVFEHDEVLGQFVVGYVDSDYASDLDKCRSTTEAVKEVIWLNGLMEDLGVVRSHISLYCDSQSTIYLAKNQAYHSRTRHIDVSLRFEESSRQQKTHPACRAFLSSVLGVKEATDFECYRGFPTVVGKSRTARVMKDKSYPDGGFLTFELVAQPSYTWCSIWSVKGILEEGLRVQVGDGTTISIFTEHWVPHYSPVELHRFPEVHRLFPLPIARAILLIPLSVDNTRDRWVWCLEPHSRFIVIRTYNYFLQLDHHRASTATHMCSRTQTASVVVKDGSLFYMPSSRVIICNPLGLARVDIPRLFLLLWSIWGARNSHLHQGSVVSDVETHGFVTRYMANITPAAPPLDLVHRHIVIFCIIDAMDAFHVEYLGCLEGMYLTVSLAYQLVIVEGDLRSVISRASTLLGMTLMGVLFWITFELFPSIWMFDAFNMLAAPGTGLSMHLRSERKERRSAGIGGAWPVIGHLHLFSWKEILYRTLFGLSKKYGPVFSIRLGSHKALGEGNMEMAKELLTVHDKPFATRPSLSASKLLGYNYAIHEPRRTKRRGEQWFADLTHNLAFRIVVGNRYYGDTANSNEGEARQCQKSIKEYFHLFGTIVLSDAIPFLWWRKEELAVHVGKDRHVDESDIKNLVYLQAIVKETLRLYQPSPILALRAAMEECTLSNGYHVTPGTRLLLNALQIQHDERVWTTPEELRPERFLTTHKDLDLRGQNFELLPFGEGRRACSGVSLALQVSHLSMASVLHCFDIDTPGGQPVGMTESASLANVKATPLQVLLKPCLSPQLYQL
ncbi:Cytochrome P450 82A4 [Hibiscus syriacus]|uniref:Cytochrome P450 82A4 n=1 Tax=Hibiscus syriacus TaxID=106335 RepID=A0A6A2ZW21_HIBSY|nr:Cytochrome P450 82A4 [Hibiscus syriacus]